MGYTFVRPRATNTGVGGDADTPSSVLGLRPIQVWRNLRERSMVHGPSRDSVHSMRGVLLLILISSFLLVPAGAQAQSSTGIAARPTEESQRGTELALGPHLIRREHSSESHLGGGVTVARRFGGLAGVLEGSGTRREGMLDEWLTTAV